MAYLDIIFSAYFNVVPYGFFQVVMTGVVVFSFIYIFTSKWDLL